MRNVSRIPPRPARRRTLAKLVVRVVTVASLGGVGPASGQSSPSWPTQPIRLVAGGAGSVSDIRARWLGERLGAAIGQPVVVQNNGAAGGTLGAVQVARATPDGHTLLFTHQGNAAVNPHLYASPGYDALRDFAYVARFGIGALLLVVPTSSPVRSLDDLLARGKSRPDSMNFGSPGNGVPPHLAAVEMLRLGGIRATHVPYKGGGAMMAALIAGEVDWAIEGLTATLPQVKSGRLRPLAVTSATRASALPEVPTIAEAGVPGYDYIAWTGIAAPAATPVAVIERLNDAINRIATSEDGRRWFASGGADPGEQSPSAFGEFVRAEHAKLGAIVRAAGVRAE